MDLWTDVRRRVLACGQSKRSVQALHKIHWKTLNKILAHSGPPGYRKSKPRKRPKLDPFIPVILQWLEEDKGVHKKQRHTARRIFNRLVKEHGYQGGHTVVKDFVREPLDLFLGNARWELIGYCFADSLEATLQRLDALNCPRDYRSFSWNCEEFVMWACGREPQSPQRSRAADNAAIAGLIGGLLAILCGGGLGAVLLAGSAGAAGSPYITAIPSIRDYYRALGFITFDLPDNDPSLGYSGL